MKIETHNHGPFWSAVLEGYDGAPDATGIYSVVATGPTESAAIDSLKEMLDIEGITFTDGTTAPVVNGLIVGDLCEETAMSVNAMLSRAAFGILIALFVLALGASMHKAKDSYHAEMPGLNVEAR